MRDMMMLSIWKSESQITDSRAEGRSAAGVEGCDSFCYNRRMNGRAPYLSRFAVILILAAALSGCARSPEGLGPLTPREVSFRIDFDGPINDNYYYFVAIDIAGGGDGPTPVFPGIVAGQGWVTGSATHFVQYHMGQYTVWRITDLQPLRAEPIGAPLRSTPPEVGGKTLGFTLDLNAIGAASEFMDVNIIAIDQPLADVRMLDGLGQQGTEFLILDISSDRTYANTEDTISLEPKQDVLDQNRDLAPRQPNDQTQPLDIVDWTITIDV
ncbi:MAG TPA: hypothetical protein VMX94_08330 [Armatimonadota bacterium]|nr:hypothetical protein [Armatimonadota bacterium]